MPTLCYSLFKWKPYSLRRNYGRSGECIRCPQCGSRRLKETVKDTIANHVCEIDTNCQDCGAYVNFWAYGSYEPCFQYSDRSWPALWIRIQWRIRRLPEP